MGGRVSNWWTGWGAVILVWALFPLAWMVSLSFKDPDTFRSSTPKFWPEDWSWQNYRTVFSDSLFTSALRNSFGIAIIATLIASAVLYIAVGAVGIATVGHDALAQATQAEVAPLVVAARTFDLPAAAWIVAVGAMTAMLGVALNLILGLSRVLLAMGRRGDMPARFAHLSASGSPTAAIVAVGIAIFALVLICNVKVTWSFSAFTVLVYYAITNLAALKLRNRERLYSRWWAWLGLIASLSLAFAIEWQVWASGMALLGLGLIWHAARSKR